ncbi:tau 95 subunit of transcription factor TFIIIC [Coemansia sp. RSA 1807]|nr:tau 95 subunit of transcription factor TFIIIC [Coemansia sp. RSA 1807]
MANSGSEMAERWPLPERTVLAVDYPGYVVNADRAIQTIGGSKKLARDVVENVGMPIELRYRYKDPTSHPIKGEIISNQNLLLVKVTRRVKKTSASSPSATKPPAIISAKVVAVIDKSVRFRKLADFQYIVPKTDPLAQITDALRDINVSNIKQVGSSDLFEQAMDATSNYIPAPFIDRFGWPSQFRPRTHGEAHRTGGEQTTDGEERRTRVVRKTVFHGISIEFGEETVPTHPSPGSVEDRRTIPETIIEKAAAILEQYPVISRNAMEVLLPPAECDNIRHNIIMPTLAYLMEKGPWRSCWIRFGYDPRKHPESRLYQVLDIRRSNTGAPSGRVRSTKRGAARQNQPEITPLNAVRMQNIVYSEESARQKVAGIFQFMHTEIQPIRDIIDYEKGWRTTPCEKSGWLQPLVQRYVIAKLRTIRRHYEEPGSTPDGLQVDYDELDKIIEAGREVEEAERITQRFIDEREQNLTQGQPSQELRERVDAQVDEFMRILGTQKNASGDGAGDEDASEDDDFDIYDDDDGDEEEDDAK